MEYDDQPLDLSLPKKRDIMGTIKATQGQTDNIFKDIEPLVLPKPKRCLFRTTNLEDPAILEKVVYRNLNATNSVSVEPTGFHTSPLTNGIQNEAESRPSDESSSFVEEDVSPVDNLNESVDKKEDETETLTAEAVTTFVDQDNDDNCSITSDISLFAPTLSDTSDSDREDSVRASMNENERTNGWHLDVQEELQEKTMEHLTMDHQIKEIFAMTIKNSPKMISPINDRVHVPIGSRSDAKTRRQLNEFKDECFPIIKWEKAESNGMGEFGDAAIRVKCERPSSPETSKLNQSEHPNESDPPLENIDGWTTTKIDTTAPLTFRPKIDFKFLENVTMNIGDLNSTRILSTPNANAPVVTYSESSLPLAPVSWTLPIQSTAQQFQPSWSVSSVPNWENSFPHATTKPNQFEQPNRSDPPSAKIDDATAKIDTAEPFNGREYKPKIDFKNLNIILINGRNLSSARIVSIPNESAPVVTHPKSPKSSLSAESEPHEEQTTSQFQPSPEKPSIIQLIPKPIYSVPAIQSVPMPSTSPKFQPPLVHMETGTRKKRQHVPMDSAYNMVTRSQSARLEVAEFEREIQSVPVQSMPPKEPSIVHSVPMPVVINSPTAQQPAQPLHGMQSAPIKSAPPWLQQSANQSELIVQENLTISSTKWQSDFGLEPVEKGRYIAATLKLFEQPCINFLQNKSCAVQCPYNHQLPNSDKILAKMHTFPNEKIHFVYRKFIARNLSTFEQYFPCICCLFGIRKMKETLMSSVRDCDKYQKYDFYKFVFGGLLMCGKTPTEALAQMTDFVDICHENLAVICEIANNPINPFIM